MTYQAIKSIMADLNEVFAPLDDKVAEGAKEWAKGRVLAIREFRRSDEADAMRRNQYAYYGRLFEIAGGKTWFKMLDGRSLEDAAEVAEKNARAIAAKRNATIAKKLEKAGVHTVTESSFEHTNDGFNGFFKVETDAGTKRVSVSTILAGGYNIQCLHLRVLTKVK